MALDASTFTVVSSSEEGETLGLSGLPKDEWEGAPRSEELPIDLLKPGTERHRKVLNYLNERIRRSERAMRMFHSRWRMAEQRAQAYLVLPDGREREFQELNAEGKPPTAHTIVIPYIASTIATIVTYLTNVFLSRKPYFSVSAYKDETTDSAQMMELVLQYQADHSRLGYHLTRFLQDGELYGLGVLKVLWTEKTELRTVRKVDPIPTPLGQPPATAKTREPRRVYSGNTIESVDPYLFFPDPTVPMAEVNKRGEYVVVRSFHGMHTLKRLEQAGEVRYIDDIPAAPTSDLQGADSIRNLAAGGYSNTDTHGEGGAFGPKPYIIDEGSFEIIPAELGLGESEWPEKWLFAIANKAQIIAARPLGLDHSMHPFVVSEPYTMGYGFGQLGLADYLSAIQDAASWFLNSHMQNVREVLNNAIVFNPLYVEQKDFERSEAGMLIRLKPSAAGVPIDTVIKQLSVGDVTRNHVQDLRLFLDIGDALAAVNENLRGQPQEGGRKTATEVNAAFESGTSRLSHHARLISSQALVDLTEQLSVNTQQLLDDEFYFQIVGVAGFDKPLRVTPDQLAGDFYYPPSDGTLPSNKPMLFDIWQNLFGVAIADPEIRARYDIGRIFEHIAELGGARNIEQFRMQSNQLGAPATGAPSIPSTGMPLPQDTAGLL